MAALIPVADATVTVDWWPHPLTAEGQEVRLAVVPPGTTLAELVRDETGLGEEAGAVLVNAVPVPRREWRRRPVRDGDTVTVHAVAEGDIGRAVFQVLTLAAAVFLPPLIPGIAAGSAAAAFIGAGITVAGGLLTNALFPVRLPEIAGPGAGGQVDPVYSLAGGSNQPRIYQPLPLVLGTHRVFPDLGAKEYTEFDGDEQYLFQVFNFGLGDLDVSDLRVDGTLLSSFSEVTTEEGNAFGRVALVAGNVDSTAGAALENDEWVTRQTGADTNRVGIDITGQLFLINDEGDYESRSVEFEVRFWKVGTAAPSTPHERFTVSNDDQTPVRVTKSYSFNERATWNVSVRRTTDPWTQPAEGDEVEGVHQVRDEMAWATLRSYQPDDADYTGQTRLGVKIRASGQLSGRLDRLSALVKQKIPVWDAQARRWGSANVESSNPAALIVWFARGVRVNGAVVAGVGMPDSRIDLAGLGAFYQWCLAQSLRCDFEIKGGMTHDQVLSLMAQCGRASISWQTGKLGVVWEDSARLPSGLVTPGNVIKGTFSYEYSQGAVADEVIVRYIEPDMDWQYNSVRRTRPGLVGTPQSTATVTARGVTQRDQAAVECNLQAARQHYLKRRMTWEMGREGRSLTKGSVVWITHSLIDGGITGRLAAISSATVVRLDKAVDVGADDWLLLRLPGGALHQTRISRAAGEPANGEIDTVELASALPAAGVEPVDVIWRLYDNARPPQKARIIAFKPLSDRRYRLTAIDEVAAYYALATSDLTAPFPGISERVPRVLAVQFSDRRIRVGKGYAVQLQASLTVAGDWRGGVVRAGLNYQSLQTVDRLAGGDTLASWIIPPNVGQAVEIIPGSEDQPTGPVWRGSWNLRTVPPPPPTGLAVTEVEATKLRQVTCVPPDIPDLAGVRVRFTNNDDAWDEAVSLANGVITAFPYLTATPGAGPWKFLARTEATDGQLSRVVSVDVTLEGLPVTFAGVTWHTVSGVPADALGEDGDRAVRVDDAGRGKIYGKADGTWTELADLAGADGAQWLTGTTAPATSLGKDGDWYFREGTGAEAASIYTKASGAWQKLIDIDQGNDGATWVSHNGTPPGTLGNVGDFCFDTSRGYVFEKTGESTWEFRRDITGPSGRDGRDGRDGVSPTLPRGLYNQINVALGATTIRNVLTTSTSLVGTSFTRDTIYALASGATAADGSRTLNATYRRTTYTYRAAPVGGRPSPGPSRDASCAA